MRLVDADEQRALGLQALRRPVLFSELIGRSGLSRCSWGRATAWKSTCVAKATNPQVVVRQTRLVSSTVTVVGEVAQSVRMPLTAGRERLLDALAAAGGVRQPVGKVMLPLSRARDFHGLPLELIIRDPIGNERSWG